MKKNFFRSLLICLSVISMLTPACKSEEALVWDPTGIWEFTITFLDTNDAPGKYTFDFQTDHDGRAEGFELPSIYFTYSKTGDFSMEIET